RTVSVSPGATVSGSITVQINSTWPSNATMAMGVTPSWGDRPTSYTDLGGFSTPVSNMSRTINLNYTAPNTPGTYYIIAAFRGEFNAGQVMSATNWTVGQLYWNDSDDIAGWQASTIDTANANGTVAAAYRFPSGNNPQYVPATAIRIDV